MSINRLLTAKQAAERLNVSVRTVYSWIEEGRLASIALSERCTRIPEDAVENLATTALRRSRPDLSSILWDSTDSRVDEDRNSRALIARILSAGNTEQTQWIFRRYGSARVMDALKNSRALSPRVRGAWLTILAGQEAPRGRKGGL